MTDAIRDENHVPVALGVSSTDSSVTLPFKIDSATGKLLTANSGGGTGTVTSVSVVTANGFAGTVATATTTPAITLTTTISGILKGNGTAISAASAGTDYVAPGAVTTSGLTMATARLLGRSTASTGGIEEITVGSGLSLSGGTLSASGGSGITIGTTTITSGTTTRILYDNAGVVGEYTLTGSGTVVAMQTSPTFVTDITTPVAKLSATSNQLVFQSGGVTGTMTWTPTTSGKTATIPDRTFTLDNITTATTTSGTGFVKGNGSVISFDNSTYITGLTVGSTTISSGTTTRILYDNAGTLGEYTITGSGTVVAMATAPTFVTSITTPSVLATANDSGALGASGTAFSDLFLASGAVINFAAGNVTLTHSSGLLTSNAAFSVGTSNAITCGTIELGAASDTTLSRSSAGVLAVEGVVIPSISSTNTLTNKRITKRTGSTTSSATPTINTDNVDMYLLTAQAADITSFTTNLSGTPTEGQTLWISITGTAARAITWGSSFEASTVALPTTTVSTNRLDVGFVWNTATSKWRCVASA